LTTRRTTLRTLAGLGALGALGLSATPVAAVPTQPAGSGTAADPYVITTVQELQWMQNNPAAFYVLGNDIDASETAGWNGGAGFSPIDPFIGTFKGQGYTISGLTIDRPAQNHVGLFGLKNGSITNVTLADLTVTGDDYVGGLVGLNAGPVSGSSASGRVTGSGKYVGGLVGENSPFGTVSESSASGRVTGDDNVGGLVGFNYGPVSESSASSRVTGDDNVGGLVGRNNGLVCGSEAHGSVSGNTNVGDLVGGGNPAQEFCT
jgi:hypothetical protein